MTQISQATPSDYRKYQINCNGVLDYAYACIFLETEGDPVVLSEDCSDSSSLSLDLSKVIQDASLVVYGYQIQEGVKTLVAKLELPASDLLLNESIKALQLRCFEQSSEA